MNMKFSEVPLGAVFIYRGERFTKTALSMAQEHVTRWGHIFGGDGSHPVILISLPEVPAEAWKRVRRVGY